MPTSWQGLAPADACDSWPIIKKLHRYLPLLITVSIVKSYLWILYLIPSKNYSNVFMVRSFVPRFGTQKWCSANQGEVKVIICLHASDSDVLLFSNVSHIRLCIANHRGVVFFFFLDVQRKLQLFKIT